MSLFVLPGRYRDRQTLRRTSSGRETCRRPCIPCLSTAADADAARPAWHATSPYLNGTSSRPGGRLGYTERLAAGTECVRPAGCRNVDVPEGDRSLTGLQSTAARDMSFSRCSRERFDVQCVLCVLFNVSAERSTGSGQAHQTSLIDSL